MDLKIFNLEREKKKKEKKRKKSNISQIWLILKNFPFIFNLKGKVLPKQGTKSHSDEMKIEFLAMRTTFTSW